MKKTILLFAFLSVLFTACSKDDDAVSSERNIALISVKDAAGKEVPHTTVYAFSDYAWNFYNQKLDFAEWIKITDDKGTLLFDDLNDDLYKTLKQEIAKNPQMPAPKFSAKEGVFHFVIVHNGANFATTVIFEKGEERKFVIVLK